jgi:hypothetical protein
MGAQRRRRQFFGNLNVRPPPLGGVADGDLKHRQARIAAAVDAADVDGGFDRVALTDGDRLGQVGSRPTPHPERHHAADPSTECRPWATSVARLMPCRLA